jgi:hypothetical protein|tara:strand:- start:2110 stop:2517 length:408 start_codon:yes stop_codon:yes gene_type:complete
MEQQQLLEVANDLTNDNICDLINMVAPRLDVYFGLLNMRCLSSGISFASMNGTIIQVNCESADLEDLADDDFIAGAIEKTVQKESGRALILADSAHLLAEKINKARFEGKNISDKQTVKLCEVLSVLTELLGKAA